MGHHTPDPDFLSLMSLDARAIVTARADTVGEPYNLCLGTSFKLMDDLLNKGFPAHMLKCRGLLTLAPDADQRWLGTNSQSDWVHYVVILGDEVIDLTRRQFFPISDYPFVQTYGDFRAEWSDVGSA